MCATLAITLISSSAFANTITPEFVSSDAAGNWIYQIDIVTSQLQNGDFFTINDFGPAVLVAAPATWTFSQANTGPNALPLGGLDDPTIANLTFTWNAGVTNVVSALNIGPFHVLSPFGAPTTFDFWTSQDHLINVGGPAQGAFGNIEVPVQEQRVPDGGSTMALLGMTLVAVAGLRRKFNL